MKILLICNKSPWPPKDGGSAATLSMITGLVSGGAQVMVLAMNTSKHHADPEKYPHNTGVSYQLVPVNSGIKSLNLFSNLLFSDKPYTMTRFESGDFKNAISSVLRNKFDIIQIEGLAMTYYLPLIRGLTTGKIVFRPHNVENLIWEKLADEERNPLIKRYLRVISSRTKKTEQNIINGFDALAAITKTDLEWFINSGLSIPSCVSPPGVAEAKEKTENRIKGSVFFIGALDWRPNISGLRWFIRNVWPGIIASNPGASFHIAGRNPSKAVRKMCRGKGIIFYGEVESSSRFICDKEVMTVPLFSGSGIRVKIIEGMNLGKPVVATSEAARGIDCINGYSIFLADDANSFALQVSTLLRNEKARLSAGVAAIENVRKNYNILVAADNLLKFYSQLPR